MLIRRSTGANLVFQETQEMEVCKQRASELALQSDSTLVLPSDQEIIVGQGSVCLEILEQVPDIDAVIVPCGSGSLLAGARVVSQGTKTDVLAAEPEQGGPSALREPQDKTSASVKIRGGPTTLLPTG